MLAVVTSPSPVVVIVLVLLVVLILAPRTVYRSYAGPSSDWLWLLVILIVILWLLGVL